MASGTWDSPLPHASLSCSLWGHCIIWTCISMLNACKAKDLMLPGLGRTPSPAQKACITQLGPSPRLGKIVLNPLLSQVIWLAMRDLYILGQFCKRRDIHWKESDSSELIRDQNLRPDPDHLFRLVLHSLQHCSDESNVDQMGVKCRATGKKF